MLPLFDMFYSPDIIFSLFSLDLDIFDEYRPVILYNFPQFGFGIALYEFLAGIHSSDVVFLV